MNLTSLSLIALVIVVVALSSGGVNAQVSSINFSQFTNAVTSNGYPSPSQAQFNSFKNGLPKGLITTTQEAAMALAQFIHESAGLTAKREIRCGLTGAGCPGEYVTPGCDAPGQRYFGRGYIQLSWCENYKSASRDLFAGDERLVRDPDMVARDEGTAWDTAFSYWKRSVHGQNGVADGKFGSTTRAINGRIECDGDRKDLARRRFQLYGKVRAAFGLQGPGDERGCYN